MNQKDFRLIEKIVTDPGSDVGIVRVVMVCTTLVTLLLAQQREILDSVVPNSNGIRRVARNTAGKVIAAGPPASARFSRANLASENGVVTIDAVLADSIKELSNDHRRIEFLVSRASNPQKILCAVRFQLSGEPREAWMRKSPYSIGWSWIWAGGKEFQYEKTELQQGKLMIIPLPIKPNGDLRFSRVSTEWMPDLKSGKAPPTGLQGPVYSLYTAPLPAGVLKSSVPSFEGVAYQAIEALRKKK